MYPSDHNLRRIVFLLRKSCQYIDKPKEISGKKNYDYFSKYGIRDIKHLLYKEYIKKMLELYNNGKRTRP